MLLTTSYKNKYELISRKLEKYTDGMFSKMLSCMWNVVLQMFHVDAIINKMRGEIYE